MLSAIVHCAAAATRKRRRPDGTHASESRMVACANPAFPALKANTQSRKQQVIFGENIFGRIQSLGVSSAIDELSGWHPGR
jgi:hypothetical protein